MPKVIDAPLISCAGHMLQMLPQRALWWGWEKTLLVADVHLGKGATFRAQGQPLPRGGSSRDLQRLSALVTRLHAQRLVVLGDFWHSRQGLTLTLFHALQQWRRQHAQLRVILVCGNHDRAISKGNVQENLGIELVDEPFPLAPGLYACHVPPLQLPGFVLADDNDTLRIAPPLASGNAPETFYLAGHLHPAVRLAGKGHDSVRLPCFVWQAGQLVLPAFGNLTGHVTLDLGSLQRRGARVGIVAPDAVWLV